MTETKKQHTDYCRKRYRADSEYRERVKLNGKKYRQRNFEKVKEKGLKYRQKHREELRKRSREWHRDNPEKAKDKKLKFCFGISLDDYNKMFEQQKGCCAICGKHQSELKQSLHVDHNHKTKKIRGLLCFACNRGLGSFEDNLLFLSKAIIYLREKDV